MPRPRKLPDADELHALRVAGVTYDEISSRYGVTKQAVHLALQKSHLVTPRPRYTEEIPWTVAMAHRHDYRLGMLRLAAREKHGLSVPAAKRRYLHNWLENLARPRADAPLGVVVDYDRDFYPDGFAYVPKEPTDDWIIRRPADAEE